MDSFLEPIDTLILAQQDLYYISDLQSCKVKFVLLNVTKFVVICYNSNRKQIQCTIFHAEIYLKSEQIL